LAQDVRTIKEEETSKETLTFGNALKDEEEDSKIISNRRDLQTQIHGDNPNSIHPLLHCPTLIVQSQWTLTDLISPTEAVEEVEVPMSFSPITAQSRMVYASNVTNRDTLQEIVLNIAPKIGLLTGP